MQQSTDSYTEESVQIPTNPGRSSSHKKKILGIGLIVGPFIGLFVILVLYSVMNYMAAITVYTDESTLVALNVASSVTSLLGIACVLGFFICIPLGIYFLVKK